MAIGKYKFDRMTMSEMVALARHEAMRQLEEEHEKRK